MSRTEWEAGTIKLPTAEFPKVIKGVQAKQAELNAWLFERAQEFWAMIPAAAKRTQGVYLEWARAFCFGHKGGEVIASGANYKHIKVTIPKLPGFQEVQTGVRVRALSSYSYGSMVTEDRSGMLLDLLHLGFAWKAEKARRILKTDLPAANGAALSFSCNDGTIVFDRKASTVFWGTSENNHAVEDANRHPVAIRLFELLDKVAWTRGSGGEIVGNNEYNRCDRSEGGGANYVVVSYGPTPKGARVTGRRR